MVLTLQRLWNQVSLKFTKYVTPYQDNIQSMSNTYFGALHHSNHTPPCPFLSFLFPLQINKIKGKKILAKHIGSRPASVVKVLAMTSLPKYLESETGHMKVKLQRCRHKG